MGSVILIHLVEFAFVPFADLAFDVSLHLPFAICREKRLEPLRQADISILKGFSISRPSSVSMKKSQ